MKLTYIVKNNGLYKNVSEILKCEFKISNRLLHKLKLSHSIFINNVSVLPHQLVNIGDIVSVNIQFDEDNSNISPTKMNLQILYEDDAYLVVDKVAGMPVHPSMEHYTDSLSNGIKYYFDLQNLKRKIRPVNRIDKDTSGIVIFAKNEYIQESLIDQMKLNVFKKEYVAICEGIFEEKQGTICAPIARKENSIIERCVQENGDNSITHYEVLNEIKFNNICYSIVKFILETGRTHQIRVHMQYIGHPILGDTLYGNASSLISRQALHAYRVNFIHPITKKDVSYTSPIPDDMKNLMIEK